MPAIVRPALPEDLPTLAKLGAELVRVHHQFEPTRFFLPDAVEVGYEHFLRGILSSPDVVLLAAEQDARVVGYSYGRLEPKNWNTLLDNHGAIHDLFVESTARRQGIARALMLATIDALRSKGARQLVLYAAVRNSSARALFETLGFLPTMTEMTRSG